MSNDVWRILIGLVIIAHGAGHILFLGPWVGRARWGQAGHSWLLSGRVPDIVVLVVGDALWLVAMFGFMVAGGGILGQHEWWRALAVASAVVSLLGLALFGRPIQPVYSAGLMDIVILVALLLVHWPSVNLVGS